MTSIINAVWAFGSTTPRENQKWFFDFFLSDR
jgi:hypothetical protein